MRLFSLRIAFQFVAALAGMGISIVTARALGPEGKGILSVALLIPFFAATIASLGLNDATSYLHHRLKLRLGDFSASGVSHIVLIGLPVAVLTFLLVDTGGLGIWDDVFNAGLALVAAALFLLRLGVFLGRGIIRADGRFNTVMAADAVEVVAPLVFLLLLTRMVEMTPTVAVGAFLGATLLSLLFVVASCGGYFEKPMSVRAWWRFMSRLVPYGSKTQLRFVGTALIQRVNFVVVGGTLGMGSLGLYVVATSVAEVLTKIPDAASWIVTPSAASANEEEAHRLTMRYARWVLILSIGGAVTLGLVATPLVSILYDSDFADSAPVLVSLLVGIVAISYSRVLEASLIGRGGALRVAAATWVGGAILLVLDFLLIPRHGLIGAGLAVSGGYLVNAVLITWLYRGFEVKGEERA